MAVPFGTFLVVVVLWFVISLPLVFLGAYFGFRKDVISVPCRTNQIPREVPPQLWYQGLVPSLVVGGLLPFGAVFVELFFILSSIWQHRFYYMFGFLFLVFIGGPAIFFLPCLRGATLLARLRRMLTHAGVC
jgi:transmembrane 9 superfamily protein 2/4